MNCISRLSGSVELTLCDITPDIHCRHGRYKWDSGIIRYDDVTETSVVHCLYCVSQKIVGCYFLSVKTEISCTVWQSSSYSIWARIFGSVIQPQNSQTTDLLKHRKISLMKYEDDEEGETADATNHSVRFWWRIRQDKHIVRRHNGRYHWHSDHRRNMIRRAEFAPLHTVTTL